MCERHGVLGAGFEAFARRRLLKHSMASAWASHGFLHANRRRRGVCLGSEDFGSESLGDGGARPAVSALGGRMGEISLHVAEVAEQSRP